MERTYFLSGDFDRFEGDSEIGVKLATLFVGLRVGEDNFAGRQVLKSSSSFGIEDREASVLSNWLIPPDIGVDGLPRHISGGELESIGDSTGEEGISVTSVVMVVLDIICEIYQTGY